MTIHMEKLKYLQEKPELRTKNMATRTKNRPQSIRTKNVIMALPEKNTMIKSNLNYRGQAKQNKLALVIFVQLSVFCVLTLRN
jgi:hypothetical protein